MKKLASIILLLAVTLILFNCKKEDEEPRQSNRAPGEFTVNAAPTDNAVLISWTQASDPDGDDVTYMVQFENDTVAESIIETNYMIENLEYLTSYSGSVKAIDEYGNQREVSYEFTTGEVPNNPPSLFSLLSPVNSENFVITLPNLSWQTALDADSDPVVYDVYLDQSGFPSTLIAENLSSTNLLILEALVSETVYYWSVTARDDQGGETSSGVFSFTTRADIIANEVTAAGAFDERFRHTSVVFQNKMWVLGGISCCGGFYGDVWSSEDGENWILATDNPGWVQRGSHMTWVYDNKIWISGGISSYSGGAELNDVWNSEDGISWTQVTANAAFQPRFEASAVTHDGKMWVLGGVNGAGTVNYQEIWSSSDGANWDLVTENSGANFSNGEAVTFNNKMYKIGGGNAANVYSSVDGITWNQLTNEAAFGNRIYHTCGTYDNKLWLLSGSVSENETTEIPDVWYSEDGITWIEAAADAGYNPVALATAVEFQDKLWLIGGGGGFGGLYAYNHVWSFE